MQQTGYAVYSEQDGVFLGHIMGMSLWSYIDTAGQDAAIAFSTKELAQEVMERDGFSMDLLELIPVEITGKRGSALYASIEACIKAGIPAWSSDEDSLKGVLINPTKQVTDKVSQASLEAITLGEGTLVWGSLLDYMVEVEVIGERRVEGLEVYLLRKDGKHYLVEKDSVKIG
ncbi:hypothetical protein ACFVS2_20180 [Brevibacillus sp. NPDC058079]|uniref:hypothetical protein n=1 Tax=Brevibacillus sp. NPDC058079 TaxID=3346330 RepID=UPI0036E7CA7B